MTRFLVALPILYHLISVGQTDITNQLNSRGNKTGYWKVFLDDKAMPTDSVNSYFWGYEFYDDNKIPFRRFIRLKKLENYKITYDGELAQKGKSIPIDGTIKWFDNKKGKELLIEELRFEKGHAMVFKQYGNDSIAWITYDFTKEHNNIPGSLLIEFSGDIRTSTLQKARNKWFTKKNNKWKYLKIT